VFPLSACAESGRAPAPPAAPQSAKASGCQRIHPGLGAQRLGALRQSSSVALARSGPAAGAPSSAPGRLIAYVADADDTRLYTVDVDDRKEIAATRLKGRPEQVLVLADGRVVVSLRASNAIEVLEPGERADAPLDSRCVVDTAAEPVALAATPDDETLLLTSGWSHALTAFDAQSLAARYQVDLPRDPRAVIVSEDGTRAFVAHVVEARMSVVDLGSQAHLARLIDLRAGTNFEGQGARSLRAGCQGFALTQVADNGDPRLASRLVDRVFAPMVSVSSGDAPESSGYGSESPSEVSEVAVVDASAERALTRAIRLPQSGTAARECLLPRSASYDDGALYVTCLGIDALVKLDARSLDPAHAELTRWRVASGPTGVAIDHDGRRALVWSQFDHELEVVATSSQAPPARVALGGSQQDGTKGFALGRQLFHQMGDRRISSDGRACASCHPDGHEDALTWSTPDGARQTPMLAGRLADTAPYGWLGASNALSDHLKKTFERLGGEGLEEPEVNALVEYISTLAPPIERAVPKTTARQRLIDQGQRLFESAETGCASCHDAGRAFTDGERHQVLAQPPANQVAGLDTPSLRFVSGTAPYFHDGRYKTLAELLIAPDHAMGQSTHLSRDERAALVAYLETL
jgi:cytochrome c peroxidase